MLLQWLTLLMLFVRSSFAFPGMYDDIDSRYIRCGTIILPLPNMQILQSNAGNWTLKKKFLYPFSPVRIAYLLHLYNIFQFCVLQGLYNYMNRDRIVAKINKKLVDFHHPIMRNVRLLERLSKVWVLRFLCNFAKYFINFLLFYLITMIPIYKQINKSC